MVITGPGKEIAACLFGGPTVLRSRLFEAQQLRAAAERRYAEADELLPATGDKMTDWFRGPEVVEYVRNCAQSSINRCQKVIDECEAGLAVYEAEKRDAA